MENGDVIKFEVGKIYKSSRNRSFMIRITRRTEHNVWFNYAREDGTISTSEARRKIGICKSGYEKNTEVLWGTVWNDSFYASDEIDYDKTIKNYKKTLETEKKNQEEKFQKSVEEFKEWMQQYGLTIDVVEKVNRKIQDANYNIDNVISYLLRQEKEDEKNGK